MRLLGRRQEVRHRFLVPAFAGSNPAAPANRSIALRINLAGRADLIAMRDDFTVTGTWIDRENLNFDGCKDGLRRVWCQSPLIRMNFVPIQRQVSNSKQLRRYRFQFVRRGL